MIGIVEKYSSYRFLLAGVLKHRLKEAIGGGVGWEEEPASTLGLGGLVPALLSLGIILDLKDLLTEFNKERSNETVPRFALDAKQTQIEEGF